MVDGRITELEIKIAYQDDLLQALNDVVGDQQRQLIRLEEVCKLLGQRIKNMAEPGEINQEIEDPPHYWYRFEQNILWEWNKVLTDAEDAVDYAILSEPAAGSEGRRKRIDSILAGAGSGVFSEAALKKTVLTEGAGRV